VSSQKRRIATTTIATTPRIIGVLPDSVGVVLGPGA
jgi:hypothetical protein